MTESYTCGKAGYWGVTNPEEDLLELLRRLHGSTWQSNDGMDFFVVLAVQIFNLFKPVPHLYAISGLESPAATLRWVHVCWVLHLAPSGDECRWSRSQALLDTACRWNLPAVLQFLQPRRMKWMNRLLWMKKPSICQERTFPSTHTQKGRTSWLLDRSSTLKICWAALSSGVETSSSCFQMAWVPLRLGDVFRPLASRQQFSTQMRSKQPGLPGLLLPPRDRYVKAFMDGRHLHSCVLQLSADSNQAWAQGIRRRYS